jgi:hypothetical protein
VRKRASPRLTSLRSGSTCARTVRANTPNVRPDVLNDHGVRRLAAAVLLQAVADLHSAIPEYRRSATAFVEREDFDAWCALAGVNPTAARERLKERQREAA